jgi:hypothetical protein
MEILIAALCCFEALSSKQHSTQLKIKIDPFDTFIILFFTIFPWHFLNISL